MIQREGGDDDVDAFVAERKRTNVGDHGGRPRLASDCEQPHREIDFDDARRALREHGATRCARAGAEVEQLSSGDAARHTGHQHLGQTTVDPTRTVLPRRARA